MKKKTPRRGGRGRRGRPSRRFCCPRSCQSIEVEAAVQRLFAAIQQAQPHGIRYASCRLADGVTYVAMLELDDGVENPLPALSEFREFQENLKTWDAEADAMPSSGTYASASKRPSDL